MQILDRLVPLKWLAMSLWIIFLCLLMLAISIWKLPVRSNQLDVESDLEVSPLLANSKRLELAAAELVILGKRLGESSNPRAAQQLLPELSVQRPQAASLLISDTLVVKSGDRVVVFLNGRPVEKGSQLSSGERVTKVTQHAITLQDHDGVLRNVPLGNGISTTNANSKQAIK